MVEGKALVTSFEIKEAPLCVGKPNPDAVRVIAQADNPLGEVIPIIFLKLPIWQTKYQREANTLTITLPDRSVNLFPDGRVTMNYARDEEEARVVLGEIKDEINKAYRELLEKGKPTPLQLESKRAVSWMDLVKCLPQTNCGLCGEAGCTAFTMKILSGEQRLASCKPLKEEAKYSMRRRMLERFLGPTLLAEYGWGW